MTPTTTESELTPELLERVMKLSPDNKDKLIALLLDELDGPPDRQKGIPEAWKDEIARRIADIQAGRVQLVDADEVLCKMREKYGEANE
jgi:putative addiction module component (TIGR02574 family)